MHVSRIEMTGFKSFVDRTVVELEPGIAAVVGPNGCGKTNICDAIRWVLGEENVRLLRGSRIEDIIFSGTELRKPTGMAEVSLTVSDVKDVLPVDYDEVTVTRRVFRSGESHFFINKVPVRLKDIVDLFLGTGMGRRAYSVMERDMIDWILDESSGQRRKIIEEAAGISKYKVRRKETLGKLELAQRDLERVEDLISEVERRVRQLSRQAAKARRYERLTDRIKEVETSSSVAEYHRMTVGRTEIEQELRSVEAELANLAKNISVAEAEIETKKLEILGIEKEIGEHGQRMGATTDKIQEAENRKIVIMERKRAIDEKMEEVASSQRHKESLIAEKQGLLKATHQEMASDAEKIESLGSRYLELETEYEAAEGELRSRREQSVMSARQQMENMRRTIDEASAASEMRTRKEHLAEILEKSQARVKDLVTRIQCVKEEMAAVESELEELNRSYTGRSDEVRRLADLVTELTEKMDLIRDERARLGEQAARASSRCDVLRELVERYEGYESGVKALMQGGKEREGVHGVVGDIITCKEARYEPAVVAALSDAVQYVVVEGRSNAVDSVRMLKDEGKGTATLVMLDSIPGKQQEIEQIPSKERVIGRIMDFVDCKPRYRELFEYLLRDVFVVDTLEDAFALSSETDNGHCSYVTPDGDAVFRRSIVRSGGNGTGSGVYIGRREKVADLAGEAQALRELAAEQERAFQELKASLAELVGQKQDLENKQAEAGRLITEKEKLLQSKVAERNSLEGSVAELEKDIGGFKSSLESLDQELAEKGSGTEAQRLGQSHLFDGMGDSSELEAEVDALRTRLQEVNREILKIQSNRGFLEETEKRIGEEIAALQREIRNLEEGVTGLTAKKQGLSKDEESLETEVHELLDVLGGFQEQRTHALDRKHGEEGEIEARRKEIKAAVSEREKSLSRKQGLQSETDILNLKSESLRRRMLEEYEIDIADVDPEKHPASENSEEELTKLRGYLKNLGPVNLVALEEYDVEKERFDFLKGQRDDLIKARESLDETILQINKRARSEFVETFAKVRKDFRKNFQTLFIGGDADLRVRYEHDPLESPIDILAQPSGKKLENISLLSGGERALTAIAFLFAVYYTRPSPFCLLDEVDAPLDDANVMRFVNLIRDLSGRTQFLMVTHNKKTMEAASCLYGVTMEEPGVSTMVSVRLGRAKAEEPEPSVVA